MNTQSISVASVTAAEPASAPKQIQTREPLAFQNARRIQESFTAPLEGKLLLWIARHLPARINSDHLTILGFVAMCLAGASYAYTRSNRIGLLLATACLAINWFGDSLDGTIARVRNQQRPRYGFYVDHIIDSLGALALTGGLALSGLMSPAIAAGLLIAFLLLSIETYLATYTIGTFRMSFWKFGPTELRIILGIGNLALWLRPESRVTRLGDSRSITGSAFH